MTPPREIVQAVYSAAEAQNAAYDAYLAACKVAHEVFEARAEFDLGTPAADQASIALQAADARARVARGALRSADIRLEAAREAVLVALSAVGD